MCHNITRAVGIGIARASRTSAATAAAAQHRDETWINLTTLPSATRVSRCAAPKVATGVSTRTPQRRTRIALAFADDLANRIGGIKRIRSAKRSIVSTHCRPETIFRRINSRHSARTQVDRLRGIQTHNPTRAAIPSWRTNRTRVAKAHVGINRHTHDLIGRSLRRRWTVAIGKTQTMRA